MISNFDIFLSIAREAHSEMKRLDEEGRVPKPDGSPGFVVTWDPERRSFKNALIATTFAGVYFEALTYFIARSQSAAKAEKVDRAGYREKLIELGVTDNALLDAAVLFRLDRNDLVHEKAVPIEQFDGSKARFAQSSADKAMHFLECVQRALGTAC